MIVAKRLAGWCAVLVTVTAGLLLTSPSPASACSCVTPTVAGQFEGADAIFAGRLVEQRRNTDRALDEYVVDVSDVYRGSVDETEVVQSGQCGLYGYNAAKSAWGTGLETNEPYLFFASDDGNGGLEDRCQTAESPADVSVPASLDRPSGSDEIAASPASGTEERESAEIAPWAGVTALAVASVATVLSLRAVLRRRRDRA